MQTVMTCDGLGRPGVWASVWEYVGTSAISIQFTNHFRVSQDIFCILRENKE
jgi:hypothetical protein